MTPQEKLAQQIKLLEALAAVDAEITKLDGQIGEEQTALSGLKSELVSLDGRLATDKVSVEEMHKTMGELHTELRQMSGQIDRSREKLGRARNERESVAAEREMDELRKLVRDREEESAKLGGLADIAKKSISDIEAQRSKIHAELSGSESDITNRVNTVSREREQKIAERSEIAKGVDKNTLRRYEAVRKKKGSGLAPVKQGTCRACHMHLPPQLFNRLMRREALEECPSCHRILYWSQDPAPEAAEERKE